MPRRFVPLLFLALAGCASAAVTAPVTSTPPRVDSGPRTAPTSAAEALLRGAGRDDAATLDAAIRVLGQPELRRAEGQGVALTYRFEGCSLLLVFANDARNTPRLAEATPQPAHLGEERPTLAQCADAAARPR